MSDHNYAEKRTSIRVNIETKITYTVLDSDDQTHYGLSGDLSAGGLFMKTDFLLSVDDKINLKMDPHGDGRPDFVTVGNILRVSKDGDSENTYYASVSFETRYN